MSADSNGIPAEYYEPPNSLLSMDDETYHGLLAIGCLATLSVVMTSSLLAFITWRMLSWKSHYTSYIGKNQSLVLIYQLILADFLQSLGFIVSFHWASERKIVGPNGECFAQGWLIQLGDVASAFFVMAIALHTTNQVILSRSIAYKWFVASILGIWSAALMLTCLAPIIGGRYIFQRAGVWCWINSEREALRLILHYMWIFIVQLGSIFTYAAGFYYIYRSRRPGAIRINGASEEALRKAATAMLAYALVYTILSLPLAAGRMAAMSHDALPNSYYLFAGGLFTSSGWIDTILYAFTRRTLLFKELDPYNGRFDTSGRDQMQSRSVPRQNSTESILADGGFSGAGGIVMDRTVKIELDDLESQGDSFLEGKCKGYYVSAKAH